MDSKIRHKDSLCVIHFWRNNGNAFRTHDNKTNTAAVAASSIQFQFFMKFAIFFSFSGTNWRQARRRILTVALSFVMVFAQFVISILARISFQTTVVMDTSQTIMKSENCTYGIFEETFFLLLGFFFGLSHNMVIVLYAYWLKNWHNENDAISQSVSQSVKFNKNNMKMIVMECWNCACR